MLMNVWTCAGHESGEEDVQVYQEGAGNHPQVYASVHAGLPSAGPLHNQSLLSAYGPLEHLQQKRLAARLHKTTFCYDFPRVFENALREVWDARAAAGEPESIMPGETSPKLWMCGEHFSLPPRISACRCVSVHADIISGR